MCHILLLIVQINNISFNDVNFINFNITLRVGGLFDGRINFSFF